MLIAADEVLVAVSFTEPASPTVLIEQVTSIVVAAAPAERVTGDSELQDVTEPAGTVAREKVELGVFGLKYLTLNEIVALPAATVFGVCTGTTVTESVEGGA